MPTILPLATPGHSKILLSPLHLAFPFNDSSSTGIFDLQKRATIELFRDAETPLITWLLFLTVMVKLSPLDPPRMDSSVQFSSVAQSCPTLCDPMNRSTPGLPVHHQLPEFTQTHIHRVINAIQPSHPLLSPSPPARIPPSIRVFSNESTLHMRWPKYWSFSFSISPSKEIPGLSPSEWTGWISLLSKGLSRVFSNTTVQKHQFFGAQPSSQSNYHIHTWPLEKP